MGKKEEYEEMYKFVKAYGFNEKKQCGIQFKTPKDEKEKANKAKTESWITNNLVETDSGWAAPEKDVRHGMLPEGVSNVTATLTKEKTEVIFHVE